jgi:hypothetical protein
MVMLILPHTLMDTKWEATLGTAITYENGLLELKFLGSSGRKLHPKVKHEREKDAAWLSLSPQE